MYFTWRGLVLVLALVGCVAGIVIHVRHEMSKPRVSNIEIEWSYPAKDANQFEVNGCSSDLVADCFKCVGYNARPIKDHSSGKRIVEINGQRIPFKRIVIWPDGRVRYHESADVSFHKGKQNEFVTRMFWRDTEK